MIREHEEGLAKEIQTQESVTDSEEGGSSLCRWSYSQRIVLWEELYTNELLWLSKHGSFDGQSWDEGKCKLQWPSWKGFCKANLCDRREDQSLILQEQDFWVRRPLLQCFSRHYRRRCQHYYRISWSSHEWAKEVVNAMILEVSKSVRQPIGWERRLQQPSHQYWYESSAWDTEDCWLDPSK